MWDGGRGSRYAMAVPSPGPAWTGKSHEDGEEPCVLVAAMGELGQSPTWTPAVSAPIT